MIRFRVTTAHGIAEISIAVDDGDAIGPINYHGPEDAVAVTRDFVSAACGARGHILGEATTPVDLHAALMQMPELVPELLEGATLVQTYGEDIPVT